MTSLHFSPVGLRLSQRHLPLVPDLHWDRQGVHMGGKVKEREVLGPLHGADPRQGKVGVQGFNIQHSIRIPPTPSVRTTHMSSGLKVQHGALWPMCTRLVNTHSKKAFTNGGAGRQREKARETRL